jgi:hypothetical protein
MLWNVDKSQPEVHDDKKSFKGHALTVKEEFLESEKLVNICQRVRSDGKFLESIIRNIDPSKYYFPIQGVQSNGDVHMMMIPTEQGE